MAARQRAAQAPCRPQPIIPTVLVPSLASARAATAATAPVRSAVTERASSRANGSPVRASERQTIPVTVGSPRAGLPGKEVIHLSSASSPPRAGMARKSPHGGLGR